MWRVLGMVVWRVEAMAMGGGMSMMVVVVGGSMEAYHLHAMVLGTTWASKNFFQETILHARYYI